jgi:hypothetical protein
MPRTIHPAGYFHHEAAALRFIEARVRLGSSGAAERAVRNPRYMYQNRAVDPIDLFRCIFLIHNET